MPKPTIVIPITPQEQAWRKLLSQLPAHWPVVIAACSAPPVSLPQQVIWSHGPAGRGRQLNAGAALADGQWLWFLHADSELEPGAAQALLDWIASREQGLGYLDLRFMPDGPALTGLNAIGANLRSRWFGLPYGDQGLCVSRQEFLALGGFREDLERGEDLEFVVRARSIGLRPSRIGAGIHTSARRYREQGWLATTVKHQISAWQLIRQARRYAGSGPSR